MGIGDVSGSLADLGAGMRDGVEAAFAASNAANPNARQFVHEQRDDAYNPTKSLEALDTVTTDQGNGEGRFAFAILASMGSPTSLAMLPKITERQVPFFGTWSGATHLRKKVPDRVVWNTRASYQLDGQAIMRYLLKRDPNPIATENIFAFSQSPLTITTEGLPDVAEKAVENATSKVLDAYGFSGYIGVVDALREAALSQSNIPLAT